MELAEEQEQELDYDELCAEILANWTSPIYSDSVHQNPFSMQDEENFDASSVVSDGLLQASPAKGALEWNNIETRISISPESEYDDFTDEGFELEQREDKTMKTLHEKGSKCEHTENVGTNQQIMSVFIADSFHNKLQERGVDGIDVASLNKANEAKNKHDGDGDHFRIILNHTTNNGEAVGKLGSSQSSSRFKSNLPMLGSPIAGENRGMPAKSYAALTEISSYSKRGFVDKSIFVLPSRKTIIDINIDYLGDKNWRKPGVDISEFFNYGLDEEQWKDYSKLMKAQVVLRRSGQSKTNADEGWRLHKEEALGGLKSNRGMHECLPSGDPKDLDSHNSDVIIELITDDSIHENDLRREHRMITGDKILPHPMYGNSHDSREIVRSNSHNLETEMKVKDLLDINVEEDLKRKERRRKRFKVPLPILKNVFADKSKENETNTLLVHGITITESEIKDQRPTRRRKWTSS